MFVFLPLSQQDDHHYRKFMKKINKYGSPRNNHSLSQCWTHTTSVSSSGYGQIMFQNKAWGLHTYSYYIHNGKPDLEKGYDVSHKCDNKECCNPEHLEYITHAQNVRDGVKRVKEIKPTKEKKKGNYKATSASFKPGEQKGENNSTAVLTWEKVREIRDIHSKGLKYGDLKKMADKYGTSVRSIENVINKKTWVE